MWNVVDNVFTDEIKDWSTWSRVFQSIPAFSGLIGKIFEREGLSFSEITKLVPGTNAVFRVDKYVIKIFAPLESGQNSEIDYTCEMIGMKRAMKLGISIPSVRAASTVKDKYLFHYMIMDYIDGTAAGEVLKSLPPGKRSEFAFRLKDNVARMNTAACLDGMPAFDIKERSLANPRWNMLPPAVELQRNEFVRGMLLSDKVFVHGDITGDNVLISPDGSFHIIDFADSRIAPAEYELPAILFDLFDFDMVMIGEFMEGEDAEQFADKCFRAVLMHEFGIDFVRMICKRLMEVEPGKLQDIMQIRNSLHRFFKKNVHPFDRTYVLEYN